MTPEWYSSAACRDLAPLFDVQIDGEEYAQESARHKQAIATCASCPVFEQCKAETDARLHGGTIRAGKLLAKPQAEKPGAPKLDREHGSERGWRQHYTRKDRPACRPCSTAHKAYESKQRRQRKERDEKAATAGVPKIDRRAEANSARALPREHGTERGYQQHYRRKDKTCKPCMDAHVEAKRERKRAA